MLHTKPVNDASCRSSVFLWCFLLAIGFVPGGFSPPLAVYAKVFHRAGRLFGRSRRFLGCRMRVAADVEERTLRTDPELKGGGIRPPCGETAIFGVLE